MIFKAYSPISIANILDRTDAQLQKKLITLISEAFVDCKTKQMNIPKPKVQLQKTILKQLQSWKSISTFDELEGDFKEMFDGDESK